MDFRVGNMVEVFSNEDGFLGSYFSAKILSRKGKDKFIVEYKTLLVDSEEGPLKETVTASELRPVPPEIGVSSFHVLDKVDAYDLDGWWVGRVTGRKSEKTYYVYFDSTGDEYEYPFSALRLHQEFVGGRWLVSQKWGV